MIKLHIPHSYETGLIKIKGMDEKSFQKLQEALSRTPPVFAQEDLVARIIKETDEIPKADLREILQTMISLYATLARLDVPIRELAGHVCTAMEQSDNEQLRIVGQECDDLRERLINLLSVESLMYPAKAAGVVADHDRIFLSGRILTDIRAVFGPDPEDVPKGAAILHVLSIAYQQGRQTENFYIVMDSDDIESLIATLQRARSKEEGLKKLLQAAEVNYVKPE